MFKRFSGRNRSILIASTPAHNRAVLVNVPLYSLDIMDKLGFLVNAEYETSLDLIIPPEIINI